MQAVFLRYRLPAIACHPPILLGLTATLGLGPDHGQAGVTLLVQYAISPTLSGPMRSATLDLDVPAGLGPASQVRLLSACCTLQRIFPPLTPSLH